MRRSVQGFFAALALLSLIVVGCASNGAQTTPQATQPASQSASQQATPTQSQQSGGKVTIPGSNGTSVTIDSSVPDDLKTFPVPQGFTSQGMGSMTSGGDKLSTGSWTGTGQVQTVVDFYKSSLPGQGWKEEGTILTDSGGFINYSKPGGLGLTVTVSKDDSGKITIAVLYGKSSATPTPQAQATEAADATETPEATSAPEATSTPAAPAKGDSSLIPAELKDIPVPSGFYLVKDSAIRLASGGQFTLATAEFFGTTSVKDVGAFYKSSLTAKGWNIDTEVGGEDTYVLACKNSDGSLSLEVSVSTADAGTQVAIQIHP